MTRNTPEALDFVERSPFNVRLGARHHRYFASDLEYETSYVLPARDLDDLAHVSVGAGLSFHF